MTVTTPRPKGPDTRQGPSGRGTPVNPKRRKYNLSDTLAAWGLIAPALILFIIFILIPVLAAIGLSLFSWNFFNTPTWIGGDNFVRLFSDPEVAQSIGVTFEFVILGVVPTMIIGFLLAVLVNANMPGVGVLRVLYFVPVVVSAAVSAVLWGFLFDPRQGPGAAVFRFFGATAPDVLNSQLLATPALVVIMIWGGLPIVVILYLAGLQRISPDIYDAAALDGASRWRTLWSITWPNVSSTTLVVLVLQIVGFVSGALDLALILTKGGPINATRALGLYSYQEAFASQDVGYAAALSVLQLVIIVSIVGVVQAIIRRANR